MPVDVTFIEREFAGEMRRFELLPPNRTRLYKGVEGDIGSLPELAVRAAMRKSLSGTEIGHILSHALSGGHPITLLRMRDLVRGEMQGKPVADFAPLAVDIIAATYAGVVDGDDQTAE